MSEKNNKSFFKEWLEKLQQESWQLELLISGLALYGIYESQSLLVDLEFFNQNYPKGFYRSLFGSLHTVLQVGWKVFFINLLIHVILRGLWIGTIGLRYISGDINYEELNYSDAFVRFFKNKVGNYDDFIERLEKLCSVLFAFTFLIFLLFLSLILYQIWLTLGGFILLKIFGVTFSQTIIFQVFVFVYLFLGMLVFIDFITAGLFKKIKEEPFASIYLFIYRLFGWLTLSFLYRPLLFNILDHQYTKRLFYIFIPYLLILVIGDNSFKYNNMPYYEKISTLQGEGLAINKSQYLDLRKEKLAELEEKDRKKYRNNLPHFVLSQFYMDHPYPNLFIKFDKTDEWLLKHAEGLEPIYKKGIIFTLFQDDRYKDPQIETISEQQNQKYIAQRAKVRAVRDSVNKYKATKQEAKVDQFQQQKDSLQATLKQVIARRGELIEEYRSKQYQQILDYMLSNVEVHIDGINYRDSLSCYYYVHPNHDEKGILCHFPSKSLEEGAHIMELSRNFNFDRDKYDLTTWDYTLPFYKIEKED